MLEFSILVTALIRFGSEIVSNCVEICLFEGELLFLLGFPGAAVQKKRQML